MYIGIIFTVVVLYVYINYHFQEGEGGFGGFGCILICFSKLGFFFEFIWCINALGRFFFVLFFLSSVGFFVVIPSLCVLLSLFYQFSFIWDLAILLNFARLGSFVKSYSFAQLIHAHFFAYELYISVTYIGWYFILTVLYFTCQNSFVFYIFFFMLHFAQFAHLLCHARLLI